MANHGYPNDLGLPNLTSLNEDHHTEANISDEGMRYMHLAFGTIAALCFTLGLLSNLVSAVYFFTREEGREPASTLLHQLISVVDMIVCLMMLPVAISNFSHGNDAIFSNHVFCHIWAFAWEVVIRLTVFLIGVLSIIRTTSLAIPLIEIKTVYIVVPLLIYIAFLAVQESVPYWYHVEPRYYAIFASCGWDFSDIFDKFSNGYKVYFFLAVVLEFVIPFFPIVISCCISVYLLSKKTLCHIIGCSRAAQKVQEIKREASVTIIILTIFYLIFNIPYCAMWTLYALKVFSSGEVDVWPGLLPTVEIYYFVSNMNLTYTIALNSTVNPIVYIWRTRSIRTFLFNSETSPKSKNIRSLISFKREHIRRRNTVLSLGLSRRQIDRLQRIFRNNDGSKHAVEPTTE